MGDWDTGSFDNDTALDWAGDLCDGNDPSLVRKALLRVREERRSFQPSIIGRLFGLRPIAPYLEARVAAEGLAAAEVVAFWANRPLPNFPDTLSLWARRHSDALTPELIALACEAVAIVKTKSELKDLWEQGDTMTSEWHDAIAELDRRLQDAGQLFPVKV